MTLERKEDNNPICFQEVDNQRFAERQTSIGNKSVAMKHFNYNPINQFLVDVLNNFQPKLVTATRNSIQVVRPQKSVQYQLIQKTGDNFRDLAKKIRVDELSTDYQPLVH